jgi:hypothetical protein
MLLSYEAVVALQDANRGALEKALKNALPELWVSWMNGEGPRLHAEVRLALMDAKVGYDAASTLARKVAEWKEARLVFDGPERLNDAILEASRVEIPLSPPLRRLLAQQQVEKMHKALTGPWELHHKRLHSISVRMRALAEENAMTRNEVIGLVSREAGLPDWVAGRASVASEKIITQHVERLEKVLRQMEAMEAPRE